MPRGAFTEEILEGWHFELMKPPHVKDLAAHSGAALRKGEDAN